MPAAWSNHNLLHTTHCYADEEAGVGNGLDVAACGLTQDSEERVVREGFIAFELSDEVKSGMEVVFIGRGFSGEGETGKVKVLPGKVRSVRREIAVDFTPPGLLPGDSGGGLFAPPKGPDRQDKWRLIGVASSSSGEGDATATAVGRFVRAKAIRSVLSTSRHVPSKSKPLSMGRGAPPRLNHLASTPEGSARWMVLAFQACLAVGLAWLVWFLVRH